MEMILTSLTVRGRAKRPVGALWRWAAPKGRAPRSQERPIREQSEKNARFVPQKAR